MGFDLSSFPSISININIYSEMVDGQQKTADAKAAADEKRAGPPDRPDMRWGRQNGHDQPSPL
jgi:hypothetical protein